MSFTTRQRYLLYILFSLSGVCALVYEILWTKLLSLTFGTSIYAVSVVAASFMGGLALGGYLIGRYSDQKTNLLRIYAVIEIGIALMAWSLPYAIKLATNLHVAFEFFIPGQQLLIHTSRLLFCAALLIPPTVLIGGTFPLMCRLFSREKSGRQVGRLYALNTFGAALGTFLAGYVLIPHLGIEMTSAIAITGNIIIAITTLFIAYFKKPTPQVEAFPAPSLPKLQFKHHRLILFASGMTGFFALAYEILWTRVFLLYLGNTTYTFSLILCTFLIGIASGGAMYAYKVRPEMDKKKIFIRLSALMSLVILITAPFYDQLAHLFQLAHTLSGENWSILTLLSFFIVFSVVFIPTIVSGALLPAAVAIINPEQNRVGTGVGLVILCNTMGAVAGCVVAGFFMVPEFGLLSSFRVLALLNIFLTLLLLIKYTPSGRVSILYPSIISAVIIAITTPVKWDQKLMNSGVYIYAPIYASMGGINEVQAGHNLLDVIEGVETTVAVFETSDKERRFMTINGITDGSSGRNMAAQILVGQLPMLLHPNPDNVMVIGLGTGIGLREISAHPTRSIYCAEISPEVVAAEKYFRDQNDHTLDDPKIDLAIVDGRERLLVSVRKFDIITSQPSHPWLTGNSNLFTSEFYTQVAKRLNNQGLFCQWVALTDITSENLKIVINTFVHTFNDAIAFRADSNILLIGSMTEIALNDQTIRERLTIPRVADTLASIGIHTPEDILANHYLCDASSLRQFSSGAKLNTDNLPYLEFSAKDTLYQSSFGTLQTENITKLLKSIEIEKTSLPLKNLGTTNSESSHARHELGRRT